MCGELFEKAAEKWPDDPLPAIYRERVRTYIEHPPGEDWDGVFVMTSK